MTPAGDLDAPLTLLGRITTASNATFLGEIDQTRVVYKPVAGEQPLWDFPDGDLAGREVAAYLVSEAMDVGVVPRTWRRDGPLGEGMVQLWQDIDPEQDAVTVLSRRHIPDGFRHVFDGSDERDRPVTLVHEDSAALRRMAVFDVVANNADRKGGHVLAMPDGHRYGVDHGLTFHEEHKLRTVLWGWRGEELAPEELEAVDRLRWALYADLTDTLACLITDREIEALLARCDVLHEVGSFPDPHGFMPAVPWPIF